MAEYYFKNINLPNEIVNLIFEYLPATHFKRSIKNKTYLNDGFWFKRIIVQNIVDIPRTEISYRDWYQIFHHKSYSMLIKYENVLIKKLIKQKSKEEINKIHLNNLNNCHSKHFLRYRSKS